ncbi:N6AMT2 family protein [Megaselia abdita]
MSDIDCDGLRLSRETEAILLDFLAEKEINEKQEKEYPQNFNFAENWQLSQFWYSDETIKHISALIGKAARKKDNVALLSCPSLYISCKAVHHNTIIFEFDDRFKIWEKDFVKYDFNNAYDENYLDEFRHNFDIVIADPPFLSKECFEKFAFITKKIVKPNGKILFCSGEVVEEYVAKFLDLKKCSYKPKHTRNLGNDFTTYSNFNSDQFFE